MRNRKYSRVWGLRTGRPRPSRDQGPLKGGRRAAARASPQGRPVAPAGTAAYSAAPARGVGCRTPARGCRPRPALPPAGVVAPTARVAVPW
ncbi:hypothetical protein BHM03_00058724 [Ensete ventricosum]|nr:hypothetical protein BHM03_00058724 [Ensete ventricosum]